MKVGLFLFAIFFNYLANAQVEVRIEGVEAALEKALRAEISLARQKESEHLTEARIKTQFQRAYGEIERGLQAHGYYQSQVTGSLAQTETGWQATFTVDPGAPVIISELNIVVGGGGEKDEALLKAVEAFPLKQGDRLNHGSYESGKSRIMNIARERGYFDAVWITHQISISQQRQEAIVTLALETGRRYRFGEVELPATIVSEALLKALLPFNSGDPYDAIKIISYQNRLRDSNYFRDVQVRPGLDEIEAYQVPVKVSLTANARNSYRIGVGFGTDSGPRLSAAWDNHYLNRSGHKAEADLRLSPVLSSVSGSYLIPFFNGTDVQLGITSSLSREDTDTTDSNIFQTGIDRITTRGGWHETLSLNYRFEDFAVGGQSGSSHLLLPGIGYWKSVSDDPIYSRKGFRLSFDLRGAVEGLISDVTFLHGRIAGKGILPLGSRGRFISRAEIGGAWVSDFSDLPASLRFFAGGDKSIRGFDFKELGPRDETGKVIGGKYLAVGSVEYEHKIVGNWSLALFSDFGNAFNDFSEEINYSIGTGIRWLSPVGLVRLDVAAGISADDPPIGVHIVVGPDL